MSAAGGHPTVSADGRPYRLIPDRHPPIAAFETVSSPGDLAAVLELAGWTNDRIVQHRLRRLPESQWVFGRPNASIVMAAFLHGSPDGMRFTSPDLGAWYASRDRGTALVEVLNGLRREIALSILTEKTEEYREFTSALTGDYIDIRGGHPNLHDPRGYAASQPFGEEVRASPRAGICYDSVRDPGGVNWVCNRPPFVRDVTRHRCLRATVPLRGKVIVQVMDG